MKWATGRNRVVGVLDPPADTVGAVNRPRDARDAVIEDDQRLARRRVVVRVVEVRDGGVFDRGPGYMRDGGRVQLEARIGGVLTEAIDHMDMAPAALLAHLEVR